jgi:thiol-disulfide isomerase/thioredoxin
MKSIRFIIILFFLSSSFAFAEKAPDFQHVSIDGKEVLLSNYKGKVVVITFWSPDIVFSIHDLPVLNKLYQNYKDKGVEVLGLALSGMGKAVDIHRAKGVITSKKLEYPNLAANKETAAKYGVRALPTTFFIDKNGNLVSRLIALKNYDVYETELKKAIDR